MLGWQKTTQARLVRITQTKMVEDKSGYASRGQLRLIWQRITQARLAEDNSGYAGRGKLMLSWQKTTQSRLVRTTQLRIG